MKWTALVLILVTGAAGCGGCDLGTSTPAEAARDMAAFNAVLNRTPAFKGMRATGVRGREVDVIDTQTAAASNGNDLKYTKELDDQLRDAWEATYATQHKLRNVGSLGFSISVRDRDGNGVIDIASDCTAL